MATAVVTQRAFRFYADDNADPDSLSTIDALNTNISRQTGTANRVIVRVQISNDNSANWNGQVIQWQYSRNGGAWTTLDSASTYIQTTDGTPADDALCDVNLLGSISGTFVGTGYYNESDGACPAQTLLKSQYSENAVCVYIVDADVNDGDTIDLRVIGTNLATWTAVPRITVSKPVVASVDQDSFRFYADDNADPDSMTALATQGTNVTRQTGTTNRVVCRVRLQNDATAALAAAVQWQYRKNNGTWTTLNASSANVRTTGGTPADDTACDTALLGGTGTFQSGYYNESDGLTPSISISASNRSECAVCVYIVDADVIAGDDIDLRVTATGIDAWSSIPRIIVQKTQTKATTTSADLLKNFTKAVTTSAHLSTTISKAVTTSALLSGTHTKAVTTSAVKQLQGITKAVTTSAILSTSFTKAVTTDAYLSVETQTFTKAVTTSAVKQLQSLTRSVTTSAGLSIVRSENNRRSIDTTGSTSIAFTNSIKQNSLMVLVARIGTGNITKVTDTLGSSWSKAQSILWDVSAGDYLVIWYAVAPSAGANTVTITNSGSGTLRGWLEEYSGFNYFVLDQTNAQSGTDSDSASSGSILPTADDSVVIGVVTTGANKTYTITSIGWNDLGNAGSKCGHGDKLTYLAESQTYNNTFSPVDNWGSAIANFISGSLGTKAVTTSAVLSKTRIVPTYLNNSARSDGSSNQLDYGNEAIITTGDFSIGGWFQIVSDRNDDGPFWSVDQGSTGWAGGYGVGINTDGTTISGFSSVFSSDTAGYAATVGSWYYIVLSRSGTTVSVRVFDDSSSTTPLSSENFGGNTADLSSYDHLRIFGSSDVDYWVDARGTAFRIHRGVAWTNTQARAESQSYTPVTAGGTVFANYKLKGISTDSEGIYDSSGNGRNLTNSNTTTEQNSPTQLINYSLSTSAVLSKSFTKAVTTSAVLQKALTKSTTTDAYLEAAAGTVTKTVTTSAYLVPTILSVDLSTQVPTDGAVTTPQLTTPAGKSTSAFSYGKLVDNINPVPQVSVNRDGYTELEWSLLIASGIPYGEYELRVVADGIVLDAYTADIEFVVGADVSTDAILQKTLTKNVTTSAVLQKTLTKSVTTSAVLQGTLTKTVTTSALLQSTLTKATTTSAVLQTTGLVKSVTTSAVLEDVFYITLSDNVTNNEATTAQLTAPSGKTTSDFSAGVVIESQNPTGNVTIGPNKYTELEFVIEVSAYADDFTDYVFRVTNNGVALDSYEANSLGEIALSATATGTKAVTTSAVLQKTLTKSVTTDAYLVPSTQTYTKAVTTSAVKSLTQTKAVTTSAVLQQTITKAVTTSAVLQQTLTKTVTTSAVLQQSLTRAVTTSADLQKILTKAVTTSALLSKEFTKAVTTSADLQKTLTKAVTTDAMLTSAGTKFVTTSAILQQTLTKAVTTSALKSLAQTKDATTSAVLQATFTRAVTTSAVKQLTLTKAVTTSAVLRQTLSRAVTTSAVLQQSLTKAVTTSAVLQKALTKTVTTSAVLQQSFTKSVTTSGILSKTFTKAVTTNADLQKTLTKSVTTSAYKFVGGIISTQSSAVLQKTLVKTVTTDALLATPQTKTITTSAVLRATLTRAVTTSAVLRQTLTKSVTTSAVLQSTETAAVTTSAVLRLTQIKVVTTSALLYTSFTKAVTTSAVLQKTQTKAITTSAVGLGTVTKAVTTSAYKSGTTGKVVTTSAVLQKALTKAVTTSAFLYKTYTKAVITSAVLRTTLSKAVTTSALLYKVFTKAVTSSAVLAKLNQTKTVTTSAWLSQAGAKAVTTSAVLKGTITKAVTTSAYKSTAGTISTLSSAVLQKSFTKTVTTSAFLSSVDTKTVTTSAVLRSTETAVVTTSAVLTKQGLLKTVTTTGVLQKSFTREVTTSAVLQAGIIAAVTTDAVTEKTLTKSVTTDATVASTYTKAVTTSADLQKTQTTAVTTTTVLVGGGTKSVTTSAVLVDLTQPQAPSREWLIVLPARLYSTTLGRRVTTLVIEETIRTIVVDRDPGNKF